MGLTPLELQQQPFKTVFRGYDQSDVQHILSGCGPRDGTFGAASE